MGKDSGIEWTNHTQNFWRGCHKVSAGCKNCYMFREQSQRGIDPTIVTRAADRTFTNPLRWKEPAMVFTCSYSDFFIEEADEWRDEAWKIIKRTPHLTYQILTKRPENIEGRLPTNWGDGYKNVWLGVSVEDQPATRRIDELVKYPAFLYFVSHEPLLSEIDIASYLPATDDEKAASIDWGIVGGESGPRARAMHLRWATNLIRQYRDAHVPVFVKQMGTWMAKNENMRSWKGTNINEWHPLVQVREMPETDV